MVSTAVRLNGILIDADTALADLMPLEQPVADQLAHLSVVYVKSLRNLGDTHRPPQAHKGICVGGVADRTEVGHGAAP